MQIETVIGIDPGLHGAIAGIDLSGEIQFIEDIPIVSEKKKPRAGMKAKFRIENNINLESLCNTMKTMGHLKCKVFLEKVNSRPGEGVSSAFKFGKVFGTLEALLVSNDIDYERVPPATWCNLVHLDGDFAQKAKQRSLNAFKSYFPDLERPHGKIHDGVVDALLIAEYGRRIITGALR